jgi:hypothetical protein
MLYDKFEELEKALYAALNTLEESALMADRLAARTSTSTVTRRRASKGGPRTLGSKPGSSARFLPRGRRRPSEPRGSVRSGSAFVQRSWSPNSYSMRLAQANFPRAKMSARRE